MNGSSSIISFPGYDNALASATLLFIPPDNELTGISRLSSGRIDNRLLRISSLLFFPRSTILTLSIAER